MMLIIDTNVLVGELSRDRGRQLIRHPRVTIHATEKVLDETQYELNRRINAMIQRGRFDEIEAQRLLALAQKLIADKIMVVPPESYSHQEQEARRRIPRDPDDWETVALALEIDAAIWTLDCDFLGCGCSTWTTETLMLQLNSSD